MLMSTVERRQEEKEQRRNDIIDAAEVVFARKGEDKATMADVAKEARLSRGLIYFYFKDKDDLYLAIMVRATQALREAFQQAATSSMTGYEKIQAMGRAYVGFYQSEPDYFHAIIDFESRKIDFENPIENESECLLEGNKVLTMMAEAIVEGMEDGSIRKDIGDPLKASVCLWGFTHGVIQIAAKKEDMFKHMFHIDPAELIDQAFDMMERSLMK
ncbi:MAG: TetR/AcrR family transcriptional regulator [Rhodothermales bacterium]